jgi:hypothetical protein
MIFVDTNQTLISFMMLETAREVPNDMNFVRTMMLNYIIKIKKNFGKKFGSIVLCFDSNNCWRKDIFANYKCKRKKQREDSGVDWDALLSNIRMIAKEMKEVSPIRVLQVDRCEADDVIAVMCQENSGGKNLILSSDKDFLQLHYIKDLQQFSFIKDEFLTCEDPIALLENKILEGDSGDSVPSVLSPDDIFITDGARQKPLTQKRRNELLSSPKESWDAEILKNYKRNESLIAFSSIPDTIRQSIIDESKTKIQGSIHKLMTYMSKNGLYSLVNNISEFNQ